MTAWTYFNGEWHEGNPLIMGPMTHAPWLGSCVFDGARSFDGMAPDLDMHCERLINSAHSFALKPTKNAVEIEALAREGIAKFEESAELYIRPMFWSEGGFVDVDPDTTQFSISVYHAPLPEPAGMSVIRSSFRRPNYDFAPTDAKAACHYPNSARALREAKSRGYENAVLLDAEENVSELATANIMHARDGVIYTPVPNGTFLNGVTRRRVMALLAGDGVEVRETSVSWDDLLNADEVFSTGNWAKVVPITRLEDRDYQPGPLYAKSRELYWSYARSTVPLA